MVRLQQAPSRLHADAGHTFNPTMVRLQLPRYFRHLLHLCHFQSHYGAIATYRWKGIYRAEPIFQSHYGAIATWMS